MRLCLPCCQLCLSRCGARELLQVSRSSRAPPHTQKPWGKSAFDSQPQPGRKGQRLHLSKTQARNNVSCMRSEESFESVSSPIKVSSNRVERLDPFRQLEGRIDSIECGVARRIGTVSDCMSDAGPPGGPRRRDKTPAAEARGRQVRSTLCRALRLACSPQALPISDELEAAKCDISVFDIPV
jgi:hypothetical protein